MRLFGLLWVLLEGNAMLLLEEPEISLNDAIVKQIPLMLARLQRLSKTKRDELSEAIALRLIQEVTHTAPTVPYHVTQQLRRGGFGYLKSRMLRQGIGYNAQLTRWVQHTWNPSRAAARSPSLQRALKRLHDTGHAWATGRDLW